MPFGSLWIPVLVASATVFVLSAILHMVLRYHRADYRAMPGEEAVAETMRKTPAPPGLYVLPHCADPAAMKDPAVRERYDRGPVAMIVLLRNGPPAMGKALGQWAALCFLVTFVAAYVARHTLLPGTDGLTVMRVTGTVALVGYGFGYFQDSIWKGIPWSNSLRGLIDSVVYAVATGIVFRLFWPGV